MIILVIIIIEFVNQLQNRIISSGSTYNVSSIHQRSYGLPIPITFPRIFSGVNKTGFVSYSSSDSLSNISSILFPSKKTQNDTFTIIERDREVNSRVYCDSVVGMTGKIVFFVFCFQISLNTTLF